MIAKQKTSAIICLCAIIFLLGCICLPDVIMNMIMKVETVNATSRDVILKTSANGKIANRTEREYSVSFDCVIKKISVKAGDYVNSGDVIAEIDIDKTNAMQNENDALQIDDTKKYIKSTVSGYVSAITVSNGAAVSSGTTICSVIDTTSLYVEAFVPEGDISKISVGQRTTITGQAFSGKYFGEISQISAKADMSADGQSGVYATVKIIGADQRLKSGFSVNVEIETKTIHSALCLPLDAIDEFNGVEYVYVYKNGKAQKTKINTTVYTDNYAVVKNGIDKNDEIVKCAKQLNNEDVISVLVVNNGVEKK